jgi:hypothetical protein
MSGNLAAIEYATIREWTRRRTSVPLTEIVLPAAIEREIRWQLVALFIEETDKPTPVFVMTVAKDEGVDLARINSLELHICHQCLRRVAEIEQDRAGIVTALRIKQQRKTPLGMKRPSEIRASGRLPLQRRSPFAGGKSYRKRRRRARAR